LHIWSAPLSDDVCESQAGASGRRSPFRHLGGRHLTRRAMLAASLLLSACASEIVEAPSGRSLRALAAARLDPVQTVEWLNAYRAKGSLAEVSRLGGFDKAK